jgi:hypothetical protein
LTGCVMESAGSAYRETFRRELEEQPLSVLRSMREGMLEELERQRCERKKNKKPKDPRPPQPIGSEF